MTCEPFDAGDPTVHVALSTTELSMLGLVAFDPDALPAVRAGQRINTIDGDDSDELRHTVPLDAWPEALWRALAGVIVGIGHPTASQIDLPVLYGARLTMDVRPTPRAGPSITANRGN